MKETKKGLMYLVSVPILESAVGFFFDFFFLSAGEKWLRNLTFAVIVRSQSKAKVRSLRQFWRQNAFCFASRWRLSCAALTGLGCAVLATLRASLSGTFLRSKLRQNWFRYWRGTAYLRAAVHRRSQRPPKGFGTNKTVEATQRRSMHVNMGRARLG